MHFLKAIHTITHPRNLNKLSRIKTGIPGNFVISIRYVLLIMIHDLLIKEKKLVCNQLDSGRN